MIKAAAIGVSGAVFGLLIQKNEPGQSLLLNLAAAALIVTLGLSVCRELFVCFDGYLTEAGVSAALSTPVLRCLGITLTGRIASEVCRDAGQSAPAAALELMSGVVGLYAALPLIEALRDFFLRIV